MLCECRNLSREMGSPHAAHWNRLASFLASLRASFSIRSTTCSDGSCPELRMTACSPQSYIGERGRPFSSNRFLHTCVSGIHLLSSAHAWQELPRIVVGFEVPTPEGVGWPHGTDSSSANLRSFGRSGSLSPSESLLSGLRWFHTFLVGAATLFSRFSMAPLVWLELVIVFETASVT